MMLYLINQAKQLGISEYDLFERAYEYINGTDGDVSSDYVQYILHGLMPEYLVKFLKHLQEV
jgi:hypothetical protein